MKPSYFGDTAKGPSSEDEYDEDVEDTDNSTPSDDGVPAERANWAGDHTAHTAMSDVSYVDEEERIDVTSMDIDNKNLSNPLHITTGPSTSELPRYTSIPALSLEGFRWGSVLDDVAPGGSSESDESGSENEKRSRRGKRRKIDVDLTADMQTRTPESIADFERHLLASPNSSYLSVIPVPVCCNSAIRTPTNSPKTM